MYDCTRQYRCTIIRGKSQKEMDDLLPAYAKVIDEVCPCEASEFEMKFNNAFMRYLPAAERVKKTLDNHRTEISGKLFGMYFFSEDGKVYESERTQKFLEDNDQPAFFKDICYKMQFPNGSQKTSPTVLERVSDGICIRPNAFLLKLLLVARTANVDITKREVSLNSRDPVLLVDPKKELYRRFTPLEAARIQSFPDDFVFAGTETTAYKQIGNAIPPVLFWHITDAIVKYLGE